MNEKNNKTENGKPTAALVFFMQCFRLEVEYGE